MVELVYMGSSSQFDPRACIFLDLCQDLTALFFSVISNMPVDSEAPMMTSSISKSIGAYRDSVYVHS